MWVFYIFVPNFNFMSNNPSKELLNIYQKVIKVRHCPWCGSEEFVKHGKYKYTYRYKCKSCRRTFLPSTGTSLHYIHKKDLFISYAKFIQREGMASLKKMCKRFEIAPLTAFDWRHKILMSIPLNDKNFLSELFMQDLWFLFNQKGRKGIPNSRTTGNDPIFLCDDKYKTRILSVKDNVRGEMKLSNVGGLKKEHLQRLFEKKMKQIKIITCPDIDCFKDFAKKRNTKIIDFESKIKIDSKIRSFNIQNQLFKIWINKSLKGVATKYIAMYCNYFLGFITHSFKPFAQSYLLQKNIWPFYTLVEEFYAAFVTKYTSLEYAFPTKRKWKTSKFYYLKEWQFRY